MYSNNNGAYYLALKDNKLYKIRVTVTYIYVPDSPEEYEFEVTELNYDGISNIENIVQIDTNYFIFYII